MAKVTFQGVPHRCSSEYGDVPWTYARVVSRTGKEAVRSLEIPKDTYVFTQKATETWEGEEEQETIFEVFAVPFCMIRTKVKKLDDETKEKASAVFPYLAKWQIEEDSHSPVTVVFSEPCTPVVAAIDPDLGLCQLAFPPSANSVTNYLFPKFREVVHEASPCESKDFDLWNWPTSQLKLWYRTDLQHTTFLLLRDEEGETLALFHNLGHHSEGGHLHLSVLFEDQAIAIGKAIRLAREEEQQEQRERLRQAAEELGDFFSQLGSGQ